jgi:hypothetical protein
MVLVQNAYPDFLSIETSTRSAKSDIKFLLYTNAPQKTKIDITSTYSFRLTSLKKSPPSSDEVYSGEAGGVLRG